MLKKKVYCPECGKLVTDFDRDDFPILHNKYGLRADEVPTCPNLMPYCKGCDRMIPDEDYVMENNRIMWNMTREFYGLVSHEDLLKLPKKYGIPRGAVEIILDFEETPNGYGHTYWTDGLPFEKDVSDRVRKALESPSYFLERMENVKDELPEELYERVHKRIVKMAEKEKRVKK